MTTIPAKRFVTEGTGPSWMTNASVWKVFTIAMLTSWLLGTHRAVGPGPAKITPIESI